MAERCGPRGLEAKVARRRSAGTSLVEVLVVIVVLSIGILAIAQIFPGGFRILNLNRDAAIASALARSFEETLAGRPASIPEQILPVKYVASAGRLYLEPDGERSPHDFSVLGDGIDSAGIVRRGATSVGYWPYVSGVNVMRRVVGESHPVPAPRQVGPDFGGLLLLDYGPVMTEVDDFVTGISYMPAFQVYGPDMERREGPPPAEGLIPPYAFFIEQQVTNDPTTIYLYLPRTTTVERLYRLQVTAYVSDGTTTRKKDVLVSLIVPPDAAGGFAAYQLSTTAPDNILKLGAGDQLKSIEVGSLRVARQFVAKGTTTAFTGDPYEYVLLNWKMGALLFNKAGYNYFEHRSTGRVPLTARVTYDVHDWRTLKDDVRIPDSAPYTVRLNAGNIKPAAAQEKDGTAWLGLNVPFPDGAGGVVNLDFALLDVDSGGIVQPNSYRLDRRFGVLTFNDVNAARDGLQIDVVYLNQTGSVATIDAVGRSLRAWYQLRGDWAVQPLKAASFYVQSYQRPSVGQYYVALSGTLDAGNPNATRIYFPWADLGSKVTISEINYKRGGDPTLRMIRDGSFVVTASPTDSLVGLPYVDIRERDPAASELESTTYGFAIRNVKGSSITVRTIHNPTDFRLSASLSQNLQSHDDYRTRYRRSIAETFMSRTGVVE